MNNQENSPTTSPKTRSDFFFIREIGEGSYSKVYKCSDKVTSEVCAIKQVAKRLLLKERKEKYAIREKHVLKLLSDSPYFVRLFFTFQDEATLYFGMSYEPNGDLLDLITKNEKLKYPCMSFYSAELVEAILFMHSKFVIHRDIKPENVLLDINNHIKITDFGSCRIISNEEITGPINETTRRHSMVGTAQFVAPEVLQCQYVGYGCDFWSLGCVIFQMAIGRHLFTGSHEYDILQKVAQGILDLPDNIDERVSDIVNKLVVTNQNDRIGMSDNGKSLKSHKLFDGIDWVNLYKQKPPDPSMVENSSF